MYHSEINQDNICAISTPSGSGGVAIIRISGSKSIPIINSIFSSPILDSKGYTLKFGTLIYNGVEIDQVMVSIYRSPKSFTGEDIVEIACHGSTYIQHKILEILHEKGVRLARAGEFSQRAFLNGKMDLTQTEAIADLIYAKSESAHEIALNQMKGSFTSELTELRSKLIELASLIELELDFAEEDVEFADKSQLERLISEIIRKLEDLKQSFSYGNAIKNGVPVVIVGRPNAGKSTLLNKIINEDRAIVSNIPGTTRDTIEESFIIEGIEFRFIDTAGIRETMDTVEKIGVNRSLKMAKKASILIYLYDASETSQEEVKDDLVRFQNEDTQILTVANKIDLVDKKNVFGDMKITAHNNSDVEIVKAEIYKRFQQIGDKYEGTILTNHRHLEAINLCLKDLKKVNTGIKSNSSSEFLAMDIRQSLHHLGAITGEISTEELLGNIFANFCIGK